MSNVYQEKEKHDPVWFPMKTLFSTPCKAVPTWVAYNSLLDKKPSRTAEMLVPVVDGSPTNWDNLHTAWGWEIVGVGLLQWQNKNNYYFWFKVVYQGYTAAGKDLCQK